MAKLYLRYKESWKEEEQVVAAMLGKGNTTQNQARWQKAKKY
jgi:hypothetical protein